MYDVSDDELADARELEEAAGELRSIAGGPGGWAAGTVMDEYDRMRAELAEARAEIARLTVERDRVLDSNIIYAPTSNYAEVARVVNEELTRLRAVEKAAAALVERWHNGDFRVGPVGNAMLTDLTDALNGETT